LRLAKALLPDLELRYLRVIYPAIYRYYVAILKTKESSRLKGESSFGLPYLWLLPCHGGFP